jgi:hypothetical protein
VLISNFEISLIVVRIWSVLIRSINSTTTHGNIGANGALALNNATFVCVSRFDDFCFRFDDR